MQERIDLIEESIFKDERSRSNGRHCADRQLNQNLSSFQNTLARANSRSRSPVFGGWRERSMSNPRLNISKEEQQSV